MHRLSSGLDFDCVEQSENEARELVFLWRSTTESASDSGHWMVTGQLPGVLTLPGPRGGFASGIEPRNYLISYQDQCSFDARGRVWCILPEPLVGSFTLKVSSLEIGILLEVIGKTTGPQQSTHESSMLLVALPVYRTAVVPKLNIDSSAAACR